MPVVRPVVQQLGARVDGHPGGVVVVVVAEAPPANALKVPLGADAGDEAQANVAPGRHGAGVDGRAGPAAAVPLEKRGRGGRADAVGAAVDGRRRRWRPWGPEMGSFAAALDEVGEGLRYEREGDVEVDDEDAEDEDGEGKGGGDAGEDGERDGGDEEQGHDAGVERIEERHLGESKLNVWDFLLIKCGRKLMGS